MADAAATVPGPVALHGGGEFEPGDEPFLEALLAVAGRLVADGESIRIAVVPTAAALGRPDLAAAHGVEAFERVAAGAGRPVQAESVPVLDVASAADPELAQRLRAAHLIHFPGGDPALIPRTLPGSPALAAIAAARAGGTVLAGASAGAMAMAPFTWTSNGVVAGLGIVPGVVIAPHADEAAWARIAAQYGAVLPPGIGLLGLAERTGVIVSADEPWRVVGEGEVRWLLSGTTETVVARSGERIEGPRLPRST
jgi:cyanophycinase-like exopeptidase